MPVPLYLPSQSPAVYLFIHFSLLTDCVKAGRCRSLHVQPLVFSKYCKSLCCSLSRCLSPCTGTSSMQLLPARTYQAMTLFLCITARYWQIAALWFADLNTHCIARYSVRNGTAFKTVSEINRPVRVRSDRLSSNQLSKCDLSQKKCTFWCCFEPQKCLICCETAKMTVNGSFLPVSGSNLSCL